MRGGEQEQLQVLQMGMQKQLEQYTDRVRSDKVPSLHIVARPLARTHTLAMQSLLLPTAPAGFAGRSALVSVCCRGRAAGGVEAAEARVARHWSVSAGLRGTFPAPWLFLIGSDSPGHLLTAADACACVVWCLCALQVKREQLEEALRKIRLQGLDG